MGLRYLLFGAVVRQNGFDRDDSIGRTTMRDYLVASRKDGSTHGISASTSPTYPNQGSETPRLAVTLRKLCRRRLKTLHLDEHSVHRRVGRHALFAQVRIARDAALRTRPSVSQDSGVSSGRMSGPKKCPASSQAHCRCRGSSSMAKASNSARQCAEVTPRRKTQAASLRTSVSDLSL
jgi:hypothetical protein